MANLEDLTWTQSGSLFLAKLPNTTITNYQMYMNNAYTYNSAGWPSSGNLQNKQYSGNQWGVGDIRLLIKDNTYPDLTTFIRSLTGQVIIYLV